MRTFRERCPADARPVIVHCSAGVGRSGTFITLDRALQQLAAHADALDVFGMVHAMRRERVWMVQTEQQYICIHQCLVAVLEGQDLAPHHHPHQHNQHHNPAFEGEYPRRPPSPRAYSLFLVEISLFGFKERNGLASAGRDAAPRRLQPEPAPAREPCARMPRRPPPSAVVGRGRVACMSLSVWSPPASPRPGLTACFMFQTTRASPSPACERRAAPPEAPGDGSLRVLNIFKPFLALPGRPHLYNSVKVLY